MELRFHRISLRLFLAVNMVWLSMTAQAANSFDNPDTIVVARDGTGQFRSIGEAIEVCRAFMEYHKVIYIKAGTYKEKLTIPTWLTHIELCGESAERTIITYDDHANIPFSQSCFALSSPEPQAKIGTFRTFTLKVEGSDITLTNLTIENNSPRLGQAVALHTEGDRITVRGCRLLGHQDTLFTGRGGMRLLFTDCYIEGTTDFIFGPATAWFEDCEIRSKADSYITAASTPAEETIGYVFNRCRLTAEPGVSRVYLGRPWRPYAYTVFMNCHLGAHILPQGWDNWRNAANERTARYAEYNNSGPGADNALRAPWSRQLTRREASEIEASRPIF